MRDATPRRHRWRITQPTPAPVPLAVAERSRMPASVAAERSNRGEKPGADGVRHELVARVRREIAAGTYDTEEKWLAAEAELLRRIEDRM